MNIYFYSVSFAHVPKARYSETYVLLYCRSTTLRVPLPRDGRRERRPAPAAGLRDRLAPGPGQRRCARPGQSGTPASGHAHVAALEPAQSLPPACRARARALEGRSTTISIHQRTVRAGRAPRRLIILLRRAARSVQCRGGVQVLAVCAVRVAVQCSSHKTRPA